jgi:hypothetical protein
MYIKGVFINLIAKITIIFQFANRFEEITFFLLLRAPAPSLRAARSNPERKRGLLRTGYHSSPFSTITGEANIMLPSLYSNCIIADFKFGYGTPFVVAINFILKVILKTNFFICFVQSFSLPTGEGLALCKANCF